MLEIIAIAVVPRGIRIARTVFLEDPTNLETL
jgi:hypothetical protein